MASLGDWQWKSNVSAIIRDQAGDAIDVVEVVADGIKVGDAAQTTFALGLDYKLAQKSNIYVDYNFAGDNYASYDVTNRGSADLPDVWEVPDFGLFDVGLKHGFAIGSFDATLIGKVNNVFNTEYVSDANDIDTSSMYEVRYGSYATAITLVVTVVSLAVAAVAVAPAAVATAIIATVVVIVVANYLFYYYF